MVTRLVRRLARRPAARAALLGLLGALAIALSGMVAVPLARADANSEARVFFERGNEHLQRAATLRGSRRTREIEQAVAEYFSSLRIVRTKNCVFNAAVALE